MYCTENQPHTALQLPESHNDIKLNGDHNIHLADKDLVKSLGAFCLGRTVRTGITAGYSTEGITSSPRACFAVSR